MASSNSKRFNARSPFARNLKSSIAFAGALAIGTTGLGIATAAPAYAAVTPANSPTQIVSADAIANGYITNGTDATNAANTLSGRAFVADTGTPRNRF